MHSVPLGGCWELFYGILLPANKISELVLKLGMMASFFLGDTTVGVDGECLVEGACSSLVSSWLAFLSVEPLLHEPWYRPLGLQYSQYTLPKAKLSFQEQWLNGRRNPAPLNHICLGLNLSNRWLVEGWETPVPPRKKALWLRTEGGGSPLS